MISMNDSKYFKKGLNKGLEDLRTGQKYNATNYNIGITSIKSYSYMVDFMEGYDQGYYSEK